MKQFNKIGAEIEKIWREKNYDEEVFPAIAANALKLANIPENVSAWEVIDWTLNQTQLPEQKDLRASFGDPPITIFNAPRFHIDVYFWLEGTTAIHQHGFCGAFQVLLGSSIHSWYEFETKEKINTFTEIGEISLKLCELLEVGAVQEIFAGKRYIHSLFHLDQPSATIVVRTHKSPLYLPQYSYQKPSLASDPFFEEPNTIKKTQCLSALYRSKHEDADKFTAKLLETSDFQTTYSILTTVRHHLQQSQMNLMFNLDDTKNRFEALLDVARKRHGGHADILPKVFEHQDKVTEIVKRRSFISDPEHRFFFALLMNLDRKKEILDLIQSRFPDSKPIAKILDWTYDLAQTRVLGMNIPNALGIADFGELDLFILEFYLNEFPDSQLPDEFSKEFPDESYEELHGKIIEKSKNIRDSIIFQPLLS